ncbi:hypothetical protein SDC9_53518 [bioreactor metagenome]|uniref:Uncharacterized protein n=1 Tax=bioreactor metagenome TaxID=1076179 RepID=A0A644WTS6_9ZZZZ
MNENQENAARQEEQGGQKPKKQMPVVVYLSILFLAAFALLLLSYFMQQRNNAEVLSGLKESVSAMQSVQSLETEKDTLETQNDSLQAQVDQLQSDLSSMTAQHNADNSEKDELAKQVQALDWLREIQELYGKKYYKAARAMIEEFENSGLDQSLPNQSLHAYGGDDTESPSERYESIVSALS